MKAAVSRDIIADAEPEVRRKLASVCVQLCINAAAAGNSCWFCRCWLWSIHDVNECVTMKP